MKLACSQCKSHVTQICNYGIHRCIITVISFVIIYHIAGNFRG